MGLKEELQLKHPIKEFDHEAILNIYFTATCLKKRATEFLKQYGLTDVQLNALMTIAYQSREQQGLSQADLSDMMLVNRANVTSLVDRLERDGLVYRDAVPGDRRANHIKLTDKATKLMEKVVPLYLKQVHSIMSVVSGTDQKKLVKICEKIRGNL